VNGSCNCFIIALGIAYFTPAKKFINEPGSNECDSLSAVTYNQINAVSTQGNGLQGKVNGHVLDSFPPL